MTSDTLAQAGLLSAWSTVWPYLAMLAGFSVIVFVHELGHFVAARWAGVRVERFAIGFGKELFGFTRGETRYSFNVLPLGGYVKMLGQEDFDDKTQELQFRDDPRSFINKPVGKRMVIVSAGVVMNVLLACVLFMFAFLIGMEAPGTRIAYVEPDSPAERAGLLPGDNVRKINGDRVLEWRDVMMAVMLAPLHEEIDFLVERDGTLKNLPVKPEYLIPENTREAQRLAVGIASGVTRRIVALGPEIDPSRPDHPRIGDIIVEIDGIPITDANASAVINLLPYARGDIVVHRPDPAEPHAPPKRVRVQIPPIVSLSPSDAEGTVSVLGLAPPVRFDNRVVQGGRAWLAGIEPGDTLLNFNDRPFPTRMHVARAVQDNAERDLYFRVQKRNGQIHDGFVRPKRNPRGPATIGALVETVSDQQRTDGPRARFGDVRPRSPAARAGIENGDLILTCAGKDNPTTAQVHEAIRTNPAAIVALAVRKTGGQILYTRVVPEAGGTIEAGYNLVANDVLRVADVVDSMDDRPTPAARAGIPRGALITAVDGRPVKTWRDVIEAFRRGAGRTVTVAYTALDGPSGAADFRVPHCVRTLLGVGPEARILSIAGNKTVTIDMGRSREEVAVGYRKGTRAILESLIGQRSVPVEYRAHPLADVQTGHIDVTEETVDPWLGRVAFAPSIDVAPELTLLRSSNPLAAMWIGIHKTYYFILQVYTILERMIFSRSVGLSEVAGPLGIIDLGGKIARTGLVEFLFFMAIISANLAVINFLPLPIVDGGLMVFLIIEKIKGSPVSLRVQVATQMIGLFLIIGIFVFVTFNDAMRMWG